MAQSLDITALAATLGAYCQEHRDILVSKALLNQSFDEKFEVMDGITDELPLPNLSITDLVVPGNDYTFQPKTNALAFGARILKVRDCKVDLLLVPKVLEKTWLGKMKKPSDMYDMPFESFIMNYIAQKIHENIHLKGVFKGIYNAVGTTTIDTMNGFLKLVVDEITATNIVPSTTGVITSGNVIDKVELVYDALGEQYKAMNTEMKASPTIFDWYVRSYRSVHGKNLDYNGMARNRVFIDGSNCELVREPGLTGSQRLLCSPKENFVYGVDSLDSFNWIIEKFERTIKIMIDFKGGVQFKQVVADALSVNEQV